MLQAWPCMAASAQRQPACRRVQQAEDASGTGLSMRDRHALLDHAAMWDAGQCVQVAFERLVSCTVNMVSAEQAECGGRQLLRGGLHAGFCMASSWLHATTVLHRAPPERYERAASVRLC